MINNLYSLEVLPKLKILICNEVKWYSSVYLCEILYRREVDAHCPEYTQFSLLRNSGCSGLNLPVEIFSLDTELSIYWVDAK